METTLLPVNEQMDLLLNGEAHDKPCDSCQALDLEITLPTWFDKEKYKRGQKYIWKNLFAQYGVTLCGLLCVLAVPSILRILIGTKKSATSKAAYRRYLSTIKHVYSWYSDDLTPGTTAWKSLMAVRARHLRASKTSQRKGGSHISQRDLVLTQFSFYGFGLIRSQTIGMQGDEEDVEGYLHFWRTVGYMMGIDDRYNLCRPSVQETREITEKVCKEVYAELLLNPPEYFFFMVTELINGMWNIMPVITVKSFVYYTYGLVGVEGFHTAKELSEGTIKKVTPGTLKPHKLMQEVHASWNGNIVPDSYVKGDEIYNAFSWYDKFVFVTSSYIFGTALVNLLGRIYFNFQIKLCMFLVDYFPFLVLFKFGFRHSFVNMFSEDLTFEFTPKTNHELLGTLTRVNDINYDKVYNSCTATAKVAKNVN